MKFYIFAIFTLGFYVSEAEKLRLSSRLIPPIGDVPPRLKINMDDFENLSPEEEYRKIYFQARKIKPFQEQVEEAVVKLAQFYETGTFNEENKTLEKCLNSTFQWWADAETELYAMRMWDAWALPESGILEANVRWPGQYHECKLAEGPDFSGKWCYAYYGIIPYPNPQGLPLDIAMGICFPSTCSDAMINDIYRTFFLQPDFPPFLYTGCPNENPQWITIDTICCLIIALIGCLCVLGTLLDFTKRRKQKSFISTPSVALQGEKKSSISIQLFMSFSVISNGEKIIDLEPKPGNIPVLDGIRFITTTWVVFGHTLQMMIAGLDNTVHARRKILGDPAMMVLLNALFSVDTFFLLSGLLVGYLGIKQLRKTKGSLNILLMYLQRYLRLTPLYAFCLLFTMSLYRHLGSGPGFMTFANYNYYGCKDVWWSNLLYITNFYPLTNDCYAVAWYLSVDWQCFLLAPIFLLLLYRSWKIGVASILFMIFGSTLVNGLLSFFYELQPVVIFLVGPLSYFYRWYLLLGLANGEEYTYEDKYATDTYHLPWARIHVYMIGMLTGYILFVAEDRLKMTSKPILGAFLYTIGWIVSIGCALAIIYGPYEYVKNIENMPIDLAAFYNAASRPVWGFCVAFVIIACCAGYGGPVTAFLNWRVFIPLSRLTYSAYLVHIYVLYWYGYTQDQPMHFLNQNMVYIYLGTLILSFGIGFLVSVCIEWPFIGICKIAFAPFNRSVKKEKVYPSPEHTVTEVSSGDDISDKKDIEMSSLDKEIEKEYFTFENTSDIKRF